MNEELKNKANEVLLDLLNAAADLGSAAMAEIPLVVQELLTWKFVESLAMSGLGVVILVFWLWVYKKIYNCYVNMPHFDLGDHPELILCLFTLLGWIPVFTLVNLDWLKIWVAPRLYLLEYAAGLMK